jgi:error-prone DNA polymerase
VRIDEMSDDELVFLDYLATGVSVRGHPMQHLRERLSRAGILDSRALASVRAGQTVRTAGLVVIRQHPATAGGTVFLLLEDEAGFINVIVPADRFQANREAISFSAFLLVEGRVEHEGELTHIVGAKFRAISADDLRFTSRDFR